MEHEIKQWIDFFQGLIFTHFRQNKAEAVGQAPHGSPPQPSPWGPSSGEAAKPLAGSV